MRDFQPMTCAYNGEPSVVAGLSGVEIVREALTKTGYAENLPPPRFNLVRRNEYRNNIQSEVTLDDLFRE